MDVNTLFAGAKGHPKLQWPLAWLAREIAPHDEPLLFVTAVMRIESGDGWAVAVPGGWCFSPIGYRVRRDVACTACGHHGTAG